MLDARVYHEIQPLVHARPLHTLLAVNAILAMPIQEMLARIEQEMETNPALEREERPCAQCGHPVDGVVCGRCGHSILSGDARLRNEVASSAVGPDDEEYDPFRTIARLPTLHEHLEHGLAACLTHPGDIRVGQYLIGCLDSRGFFDGDLNYAAADLGVPVSTVERILALIQTLDPPGVGARSVQECLLIQLRAMPRDPVQALAIRMVADHLAEVAREEHGKIAEKLGTTVEAVREALLFMRRHLAASPAERFLAEHGGGTLRPEEAAVPDVILTRTPEGYRIEITGAALFAIRVNPLYRRLLQESREGSRSLSLAERDCLRSLIGRARHFIETIRRRNWTLYNCVERIVEVQRAFLDSGPAHLKPLTMSAVAKDLGISESTVSRALDGKFVALPGGRVVSFSVFFDQSAPVKERIKDHVAAEDASRPLTDLQIARVLAADGFRVARRTVAKYREEMRLPASGARRRRNPRAFVQQQLGESGQRLQAV